MTVARLVQLIGICLLAWAVAAYPAYRLGGEASLVFSTVAMLLCLVPAVATFLLARLAFRGSPQQRLLANLGGNGLRMMFVLGVLLLLRLTTAYFQPMEFALWVLGFYLLSLTLEVVFLVREQAAWDGPADRS